MSERNSYKLSCTLYGHTADVRTLATTPDGQIISGSRDLSAKLWKRNNADGSFIQTAAFTCHANFVSSVCFLPATSQHAEGLIVTGSNDSAVRIFDPALTTPIHVLSQHTNTVCKVVPGVNEWTLLSSSWDGTARAWKHTGAEWSSVTYTGHTATVWSVCQLPSGYVVTASADKTLRVYEKSAKFLRIISSGHTDCVRDVVGLDGERFISVGNDALVIQWNAISGAKLETYFGHSHYIYSIALLSDRTGFATSSEDKTVNVWRVNNSVPEATIKIPCESVWAVDVLPNGDIVTGTNDGVIRIFTSDPGRTADEEALLTFEEQLAAVEAATAQTVGGVKLSELPGEDALYVPGTADGQTKMIREGNKAKAYAWSAAEGKWQLIGDIVGGSDGVPSETGQTVYNGKEYDHVFNVDIEDGAPPLKLPYNKNEDPWLAAQNFIHTNNLPQTYLEQVANFIMTNSKSVPPPQVQSSFVDPFTGSTRYVPQTNGSQSSSSRSAPADAAPQIPTRYFPQREFLRFDQANITAIKDKLLSLNSEKGLGEDEMAIVALLSKCDSAEECSTTELSTLERLLKWPADAVFPALDVTRLLIKRSAVSEYLCKSDFLTYLQRHLQESPNNMLVLRICCNMMNTEAGEGLASRNRIKLTEFILSLPLPYTKFAQIALATLFLNLSVLLRRSETPEGRDELILAGMELLPSLQEQEAIYRGLVALGTLLWDSANRRTAVEPFLILLQQYSGDSVQRIKECADEILAITR